jgi:tRNA modification GTPase
VQVRVVDTITAIATPAGEGALAIVRISGRDALRIADLVFHGHSVLSQARGFTVHLGHAVARSGDVVDEVLATVFRAPHSYTGEDLVEFSCHGGSVVTASVLDAVLAVGARSAEAGEFTRRAFLNGRIDLSQAEAVADLIAARSNRAQRASLEQLAGRLGSRIGELRKELLNLCALLELDLDFAEEGLEVISGEEIARRLDATSLHLRALAETFQQGRLYREGVSVVFSGRPNAGKSSLFNALLKEERAIVTEVPGTTRDFLEESVVLDGIPFRLVDTAGIHDSPDVVERIGIDRARSAIRTADIIVLVLDATDDTTPLVVAHELQITTHDQKLVVAINKTDLVPEESNRYGGRNGLVDDVPVVFVSALKGTGMHGLHATLVKLASSGVLQGEHDVIITNRRHQQALLKASSDLERARQSLHERATNEFIALDLRMAVSALSEITGEVTSEDVLNAIFSQFCIGK